MFIVYLPAHFYYSSDHAGWIFLEDQHFSYSNSKHSLEWAPDIWESNQLDIWEEASQHQSFQNLKDDFFLAEKAVTAAAAVTCLAGWQKMIPPLA